MQPHSRGFGVPSGLVKRITGIEEAVVRHPNEARNVGIIHHVRVAKAVYLQEYVHYYS